MKDPKGIRRLSDFLGIFLVIAKSIKSGTFFGSTGQYVGVPEET